MSKPPSIGQIRNLDDCIKALNTLRAYFNEPAATALTTAGVNDSKDRRYVTDAQLAILPKGAASGNSTTTGTAITLADAGGTSLTGKVQIRFMGLNPDGSNQWQLEVV